MFNFTLFATAKLGNQPRCPSTDAMIKKMWCINTPFGYTDKGNMTFAEKLVDPNDHFAKKNKSEKDKFFVCVCFFNLICRI